MVSSSSRQFQSQFQTAIRDLFSVQAAVCRDSTGAIVKVLYQYSPPSEASYGEAQAALLVAFLAISLKLDNFSLEGNSSIVISSIQQPSIVLVWPLNSIISDIVSLIPASFLWNARKVNRSVNFYAHHVANWATARVISDCIPTFFFSFSPPSPSPFVMVKIHPISPLCEGFLL